MVRRRNAALASSHTGARKCRAVPAAMQPHEKPASPAPFTVTISTHSALFPLPWSFSLQQLSLLLSYQRLFFAFSAAFSASYFARALACILLLGSQLLYSLVLQLLNLLVVWSSRQGFLRGGFCSRCPFSFAFLALFPRSRRSSRRLPFAAAFRNLGGTRFTHLAALFGFLRQQALLDQLLIARSPPTQANVRDLAWNRGRCGGTARNRSSDTWS